MTKNIQYYCVGFTWNGNESQLPRFIEDGIWENGFEGKYGNKVNSVEIGSRIAAKTTYTRKEGDKTISILQIHATGTVTKNYFDGKKLKIKWDKPFKSFVLENKGAYRSTIARINQFDTVKEIFKKDKFFITEGQIPFYSSENLGRDDYIYPCFVLTKDRWDDFGFKTQYVVEYYESEEVCETIGEAKFLNTHTNDGDLPEIFMSLNDHIASVGQSNDYYFNLREIINPKTARYYLDSVNDLAINKGLIELFEHEKGFKTSLLRSSEAQKALREGHKIFHNLEIENVLKFKFSTQIGEATSEHEIEFNYTEIEDLPYRIKVLLGKNGTGKTQYISRLASTLSGYEQQGQFSTKYLPPFSRVIAISYSLFDRFPRPKQTKTYSYYYCGFQSGKGFLTENQSNVRLKKAFAVLEKSQRVDLYGKYLSLVLTDEIALEILDEDFISFKSKDFTLYDSDGYSKYSSRQIVIIIMLAEVVAYTTDESLLIFDEPETHLHPNSISLFINVINRVLNRFNSYAIIATHSPQIVQEVPSKDILVIERIEDTPSVRGLDIETFGENLNTITERIFHTVNHDEFYREFLMKMSKKNNYKEIVQMFEINSLPLSLSAKIYLQSLYQ